MLDKPKSTYRFTETTDDHFSPEQLAAMKDIAATKPVPPFEHPLEYAFEVEGDTAIDVQKIMTDHKSRRTRLIVKSPGVLRQVGPVAAAEAISVSELERLPAARTLDSMRPEWLDMVYFPKTMPVDDLSHMGLRPRVSEQFSTEWPWNTIGKIIMSRPAWGTTQRHGSGVMVGANLMLTASHGMPWGTNDATIAFYPAYRGAADPRFGVAYVTRWRGVRTEMGNPNGLDYVICQLDWRIGDRTGWMGSQHSTNDDFYENRRWTSVGYPASFLDGNRPAVELNVKVDDVDNEGSDGREIETRPFTSGGWSGGPLWGWIDNQARVVAVNSGNEKDGLDPRRDVHAGGRKLVDLINYGRANWT